MLINLLLLDFVCVLVPPVLEEGPGKVEGVEGEEAFMQCRASGMPDPTFTFFKVLTVLPSTADITP